MSVSDKTRYNTSTPLVDFPSLGESQKLKPMNKGYARQALSMMDSNSISERDIAVRFLLNRIKDYYQVIGYVGPIISNGISEIGYALGRWNSDSHFAPWRTAITLCSRDYWASPEKIFMQVRYMDFESALRLASWEASLEVPESAEALKRASWLAMAFIREHSSKCWSSIRCRNGTKGMVKELDLIIEKLQRFNISNGRYWLGNYIPAAA